MSTPHPGGAISARLIAVVVAIFLPALGLNVVSLPAHAAAGPAIRVSSQADTSGLRVHVDGSGYSTNGPGVYVGVTEAGPINPTDSSAYLGTVYVPAQAMGAGGTFSVDLDLIAPDDLDRTKSYEVHTMKAHGQAAVDPSQNVRSPLTIDFDAMDPTSAPAIRVSSRADASGVRVHVVGRGYSTAEPGIYVGVTEAGEVNATDAGAYLGTQWVRASMIAADGSFTVDLKPISPDDLDRTKSYEVHTMKAHGQAAVDPSQNVRAPLAIDFDAMTPTGPGPDPEPGPAPSPEPGPKPQKPQASLKAASLSWGVKSSFRSYITGPIAHGQVSVSGHARSKGGRFVFPQRSTTADLPATVGTTRYRGAVRFTGHGGELDLTIGNPRVQVVSPARARLVVDYSTGGASRSVVVSNLDLGKATRARRASSTTFANVPVRLSEAGTAIFAYNGSPMYPAGTELDPVTFTIGGNAEVSGVGTTQVVGSGPATASSQGTAAAGRPVSAAALALPANACVATGTDLSWGVKESFRSYVSGTIAHGSWSTSGGATYATPEFTWPTGSGKLHQQSRTGAVEFPGTIRFTGHDGALDTRLADPQVRLKGGQAVLTVDLTSTSREAAMEGRSESRSFPDVELVSIDMSRAQVSTSADSSTIAVDEAATTLTAAGSAAFSDYAAGERFDPISFTISAEADCLPEASAAKASPETGSSSTAPLQAAAAPAAAAKPTWRRWLGSAAGGALVGSLVTMLLMARRRIGNAA